EHFRVFDDFSRLIGRPRKLQCFDQNEGGGSSKAGKIHRSGGVDGNINAVFIDPGNGPYHPRPSHGDKGESFVRKYPFQNLLVVEDLPTFEIKIPAYHPRALMGDGENRTAHSSGTPIYHHLAHLMEAKIGDLARKGIQKEIKFRGSG